MVQEHPAFVASSNLSFYHDRFVELKQVSTDQFFLGCYTSPGTAAMIWEPVNAKSAVGLAALFMVPYFQFFTVGGNFIGFTSNPDVDSFDSAHSAMTSEELASAGLQIDPSLSKGTSLFRQGSMLRTHSYYQFDEKDTCAEYSVVSDDLYGSSNWYCLMFKSLYPNSD
jgi:hypothetical protein